MDTSEKDSHEGWELFSFAIIPGANVVGDFTYHITKVRVLFCCSQIDKQKKLAFVRFMDVAKPIVSTEDLHVCVVLLWSTYNDVMFTNMKVVLNRKEPPALWYDTIDFHNSKFVVQVIRQK